MSAPDPYLLQPGAAVDHRDLEAALLAHLLRDARGALRALGKPAGADPIGDRTGPTGPAPDAARVAALRGLRSLCAEAAEAFEPAYLLHHRHQQAIAAEEAAHATFLDHLRGRLRHAGADEPPRAWSLLGWIEDDPARPLALARDGGQVILGAGVQGSGKSVFGTVLAEGALGAGEPLCGAALPTAPVFFHIEEHDRLPQLLDALRPSPDERDLQLLRERLGLGGAPIGRLRLAVLPSALPELAPRLRPYEDLGLEVAELRVPLAQLGQPGLEAALGADSGARFVQRMLEDAQDQGRALCLPRMRRFLDDAEDLNAATRRAAHARLRLLEEIAGPPGGPGLWELVEPGVATVIYLGGPHLGRGRVAPLLTGLLHGLLLPSPAHGPFHRALTIDEVNLLAGDEVAWRALVRTARLVRHLGATLALLGQDLLCVPDELFGLAGLCAVFQLRNPRVFEHLRERVAALRGVGFGQVADLPVGHALLGATHATDPALRQGARRVRVRPPRCRHGGFTRALV